MRFLASLILALILTGAVLAQPAPELHPDAVPSQRSAPVFQYALAFLATAGVLVLVCYPARRS
jgi:hypothetical protein